MHELAVAAAKGMMTGADLEAVDQSGVENFNFGAYCGVDKRTKEEILELPFLQDVSSLISLKISASLGLLCLPLH